MKKILLLIALTTSLFAEKIYVQMDEIAQKEYFDFLKSKHGFVNQVSGVSLSINNKDTPAVKYTYDKGNETIFFYDDSVNFKHCSIYMGIEDNFLLLQEQKECTIANYNSIDMICCLQEHKEYRK